MRPSAPQIVCISSSASTAAAIPYRPGNSGLAAIDLFTPLGIIIPVHVFLIPAFFAFIWGSWIESPEPSHSRASASLGSTPVFVSRVEYHGGMWRRLGSFIALRYRSAPASPICCSPGLRVRHAARRVDRVRFARCAALRILAMLHHWRSTRDQRERTYASAPRLCPVRNLDALAAAVRLIQALVNSLAVRCSR